MQDHVIELTFAPGLLLTSTHSFIHAPNSRDKLNVTRDMLSLILTYGQTMPGFLDFIFPFGKQRRAQDFHFTAFRHRTRLGHNYLGLQIPELGWSGRDVQLSYNLKSVEFSESQPHRPWSIRHCAINHSIDLETGRSSWILIKGNRLMQQRLTQATSHAGLPDLRDIRAPDRAFLATFVIHQILCDWLPEDWRWYINFLDEKHQEISRRTISHEIFVAPTSRNRNLDMAIAPQRSQTAKSERSMLSKFARTRTQTMNTLAEMKQKEEKAGDKIFVHPDTGLSQPLPPGVKPNEDGLPDENAIRYDAFGQQEFSFRDLQDLNSLDVKAGEAALVIKNVISVVQQTSEYYKFLFSLKDFPQALKTNCSEGLAHFEMHLKNVVYELELQISRIDALQQSISNCKSLVSSSIQETLQPPLTGS